jgi:hypothetical protein
MYSKSGAKVLFFGEMYKVSCKKRIKLFLFLAYKEKNPYFCKIIIRKIIGVRDIKNND